jgi:hypothetical protein
MSLHATNGITTIAINVVMTIAATTAGRNGVMAMRVAARTGADAVEIDATRSTRRAERSSGLSVSTVTADAIQGRM